MKKIPLVALLLLLISLPAVGQAYSIDNFDIRNGVRVQEAQATPQLEARRSKKGREVVSQTASAAKVTPTASSLVKPAVLFTDSASAALSSLRGYTTGNSEVDGYLIDAGSKHGVDPLLIYSVMHQESSFKSRAISPKGARGLMQLMPGTAVRFGVTNIFDPRQNIEGGARYLRFLLDRFNGDLNLTLAGYNAGEGAVDKYGWRIPPYAETQEYVRRISRRYALLRDPNAALYAPRLNSTQVARLQTKLPSSLAVYERTVSTVRLPDGRLQLMSQ
jgi:soluble lytic murein transglycosylase-like protein